MKRTPTGIITAITPNGKNILKEVELLFINVQQSGDKLFTIEGRAIDDYSDKYTFSLSKKEKLNDFFESVNIGNPTASVKFTVDNVIWSKSNPELFALVCIPPAYTEYNTVSNSVVIVTPYFGCIELNSSDIRRLGFDLNEA